MKPVVEILPEAIISEQTNLFCEVRKDGLTYFLENSESKIIDGLSVFDFDTIDSEKDAEKYLKEVFAEQLFLKNEFKNIFLIYAYNESVLIPLKFYEEGINKKVMKTVYGDVSENESEVFSDVISQKDICNIYRIPLLVHKAVSAQFSSAKAQHLYSLIIKQIPEEEDFLQGIFYKDVLIITLITKGKLQIIQSYNYKTPEDVIYYLLNICKQFQVKNIHLELSGRIEKDSNLFNLIKKYFHNITFNVFAGNCKGIDKIKEYPSHFFSYLFSLAACV